MPTPPRLAAVLAIAFVVGSVHVESPRHVDDESLVGLYRWEPLSPPTSMELRDDRTARASSLVAEDRLPQVYWEGTWRPSGTFVQLGDPGNETVVYRLDGRRLSYAGNIFAGGRLEPASSPFTLVRVPEARAQDAPRAP